eukprot:8160095-Heterocapsa_arctica.AAC.1
MTPKDARTLLAAVHVEASSKRGHPLTGSSNGPSANRPVLHNKYQLGRFLYVDAKPSCRRFTPSNSSPTASWSRRGTDPTAPGKHSPPDALVATPRHGLGPPRPIRETEWPGALNASPGPFP